MLLFTIVPLLPVVIQWEQQLQRPPQQALEQ